MRPVIFIMLLFICNAGMAQKASATKGMLKIGEQTDIIYELTIHEEDGRVSYIPHLKTIPCYLKNKNGSIDSTSKRTLEIIGNFKDSMVYINGQESKWIGKYTITSWDTGVFVIPGIKVSTQKKVYEFNAVTLKISLPKIDPSKELYDIKEQFIDVDESKDKWLSKNWLYLAGILLTGLLAFLLVKKYRRKNAVPAPQLSLKERTLLQLDELEKLKLWEETKYKEHYSEFSWIIRSYMGEKYGVNLLEKTSYESILLLKQKNLDQELLHKIQLMLTDADLMKFAKSKASDQDVKQQLLRFRSMVEQTDEDHVD